MPVTIYLGLAGGPGLGEAATWVTIILLVEVAKRSRITLKQQELIILMSVIAILASSGGPFQQLIWQRYLSQSRQVEDFGMRPYFPDWVAPKTGTPAAARDTFFQTEWIAPILVVVGTLFLGRIISLSLGYLLYRLTNDIERLPFPLAPVAAGGAAALADSSTQEGSWRWNRFVLGTACGLIWFLLTGLLPQISALILGTSVNLLTFLSFDWTPRLQATFHHPVVLNLDLSPGAMIIGAILPFRIVTAMAGSSLFVHLFFNPLLHVWGMAPRWQEGMNTGATVTNMSVDFWLSASMGLGFGMAVIGIMSVVQKLRGSTEKRQERGGETSLEVVTGRGDIPFWFALLIAGGGLLGYVVICHYLIPKFPLLLLVTLALIYVPFVSYITARLTGILGGGATTQIPFLREGVFLLSGYRHGVDVWFAPIPMMDVGGEVQIFKQLELTRTRFSSIVKATAFVLPLLVISSFIYWTILWRMAPIPSGAYPAAQLSWPLTAYQQSVWMTFTMPGSGESIIKQAIHPGIIVITGIISLLGVLTFQIGKLPMDYFYGVIGGYSQSPAGLLSTLLGALLARYVLPKRVDQGEMRRSLPIILVGFGCGLGLMACFQVGLSMISSAIRITIY
jgi:hypothetical protein